MEVKIIHLYPDLMNLYGSYANVSAVKRILERLGHTVTVETVNPGDSAALRRGLSFHGRRHRAAAGLCPG